MKKLKKWQLAVLQRLQRGETFGFELYKEGILRSSYRYALLAQMEGRDLIAGREAYTDEESDRAAGLPPRRAYVLTDRGRAALEENSTVPDARLVQEPWWKRLLARWHR